MKVSIFAQPNYSPKTNGKRVIDRIVLNEDWCFAIDGINHWIPKGYDCDGASIPRLLWPIIDSPFDPHYIGPAFAHDIIFLYHCFSRSDADEIFYQLLICNGISRLRAKIMWCALRTCAGFAWKNTDTDRHNIQSLNAEIALRPDREKFGWLTPSNFR